MQQNDEKLYELIRCFRTLQKTITEFSTTPEIFDIDAFLLLINDKDKYNTLMYVGDYHRVNIEKMLMNYDRKNFKRIGMYSEEKDEKCLYISPVIEYGVGENDIHVVNVDVPEH